MRVAGLILPVVFLLTSCGTASNINQIWGGDDEGGDTMLVEAKAAYDAKDYDRAENLTRKLLDRNPDNENAAIMLGYTMLSRGGIEPIELARELIALSATSTTTTTSGAKLQDTSSSSSAATSTLSQLGSLINITDADYDNLAEKTFDKDSNGNSEPSLFAASTNPLLVPAKVNDELRAKVSVLSNMNAAIKAVCRFVDDSTKSPDSEARHGDASCAQTTVKRKKTAKAHFLWAFAHLTEALVYQSVVLYTSADTATGAVTSNFQKASDSLNTKTYSAENLEQFASDVTELKNAVDVVFDTTASDSMITATLVNLETVNKAFSAIAGLPQGITDQITQSLNQINKVSQSLGQTGVQGQTSALKGQMTEKMATTVGEKITKVAQSNPALGTKTYTEVANDSTLPAEDKEKLLGQVTSMCKGYDTLANGLPAEKKKKPTTCTGAPTN